MDTKLILPMHTRLHLIPYWVVAAVRRKNATLSDLLDYKQAAELLSQNDIMCLLAAHQLDTELMMLPNRDHIFSSFFFCDQSTEAKRTAEMEMNKKLALRPEIFTDLKARLFSEDARHQADVAISKDDPVCGFEVVPLRDQALGVVLYNSIARVVDKQGLRYQMLREIVRQLYVYEQAPTVASSFVYSMYLKTLLRQTPMAA